MIMNIMEVRQINIWAGNMVKQNKLREIIGQNGTHNQQILPLRFCKASIKSTPVYHIWYYPSPTLYVFIDSGFQKASGSVVLLASSSSQNMLFGH